MTQADSQMTKSSYPRGPRRTEPPVRMDADSIDYEGNTYKLAPSSQLAFESKIKELGYRSIEDFEAQTGSSARRVMGRYFCLQNNKVYLLPKSAQPRGLGEKESEAEQEKQQPEEPIGPGGKPVKADARLDSQRLDAIADGLDKLIRRMDAIERDCGPDCTLQSRVDGGLNSVGRAVVRVWVRSNSAIPRDQKEDVANKLIDYINRNPMSTSIDPGDMQVYARRAGVIKDSVRTDPPVSEAQRRAMRAAAGGNSSLGIPKSVGKEFSEADPGGKLPETKKDATPSEQEMDKARLEGFFVGKNTGKGASANPYRTNDIRHDLWETSRQKGRKEFESYMRSIK